MGEEISQANKHDNFLENNSSSHTGIFLDKILILKMLKKTEEFEET